MATLTADIVTLRFNFNLLGLQQFIAVIDDLDDKNLWHDTFGRWRDTSLINESQISAASM